MKKLVCLLIAILMICPVLASCSGTQTPPTETATGNTQQPEETTQQPAPTETPTPTETPDQTPTVDPTPTAEPTTETPTEEPSGYDKAESAVFPGGTYYELTTVDGVRLEYSGTKLRKAKAPEESIWNIDTVTETDGRKTSVLFAGDSLTTGLYADKLLPNGEAKIDDVAYPVPAPKSRWIIYDNGDETYKLISVANPVLGIAYKNNTFVLDVAEKAVSFRIKEKSFTPEKYALWVSEKGNASVRLPSDVVDQIYNRMQGSFKDETAEEAMKRIDDRMQLFAEDVQKTYDSLVDLTGFVPYKHIVVWAFEHQGVMAGVVGGCPYIFVNIDWYVDDMVKMMQRWDDPAGRKEDYNFCVLHEMGHMFDWDRGWNFESEMQTDLKASYVLYQHRDDEFGAWAAPAEYRWDQIYNIDTIDTGAYKGLSAPMTYRKYEKDGKMLTRYTYSIYRSAQMYTSYVKYCEETEGCSGYEGLKRAFHWFQDENLRVNSHVRADRFALFNQKLTEFCGADIDAYMLSHFNKNDWNATIANASDKGVQQTDNNGKPNGTWIITEDIEPVEENNG